MSDLQPGPVGRVFGVLLAGIIAVGSALLLGNLVGRDLSGRSTAATVAIVVGLVVVVALLAMTFSRAGRGDESDRL